jgi:hypothetical protein
MEDEMPLRQKWQAGPCIVEIFENKYNISG